LTDFASAAGAAAILRFGAGGIFPFLSSKPPWHRHPPGCAAPVFQGDVMTTPMKTPSLFEAAMAYHKAGLCVLPADWQAKIPTIGRWKPYQKQRPTELELAEWFATARAICIVAGAVSGFAVTIDFDGGNDVFYAFKSTVEAISPELWAKLVIERTPHGWHVIFRHSGPVGPNRVLAERLLIARTAEPIYFHGKAVVPDLNKQTGRYEKKVTLIETRAEGGLFLCAPSPSYYLEQGSIDNLPVLTKEECTILGSAAFALNEVLPIDDAPAARAGQASKLPAGLLRPGDDFNQRGDIRPTLEKHGWTNRFGGKNEHWCRPGKTGATSATFNGVTFYVFSTSCAPFEAGKGYSPFRVYALLEHGGDYSQAAGALRKDGYGSPEMPRAQVQAANPNGTAAGTGAQPASEGQPEDSLILTPKQLYEFDIANDPNALLGQRWLCRGGSCLIVGQTGLGKSSFGMQAAVMWALGEPLFGLKPVRPLKSLYIQAENDVGDLAEMFQGVLKGTGQEARLEELESKLVFVSDTVHCGEGFHAWAGELITKHRPDLVWIDPLFSFIGGSVSDQETMSVFLRNGLGSISQYTGITWMLVHHANKPPRDPAQRSGFVGGDFAYLGAGSAELANWARAVLLLREVDTGQFELRAAKRGRRAGLVDHEGKTATEIFLKHGDTGICWERSAGPEQERNEVEESLADAVVAALAPGRPYTHAELREVTQEVLGVGRTAVVTQGRKANRVFKRVVVRANQSRPIAEEGVTNEFVTGDEEFDVTDSYDDA
ncbi:MAG: AAA family ATPase, partial [Rhodanobacteraceae bacterium]